MPNQARLQPSARPSLAGVCLAACSRLSRCSAPATGALGSHARPAAGSRPCEPLEGARWRVASAQPPACAGKTVRAPPHGTLRTCLAPHRPGGRCARRRKRCRRRRPPGGRAGAAAGHLSGPHRAGPRHGGLAQPGRRRGGGLRGAAADGGAPCAGASTRGACRCCHSSGAPCSGLGLGCGCEPVELSCRSCCRPPRTAGRHRHLRCRPSAGSGAPGNPLPPCQLAMLWPALPQLRGCLVKRTWVQPTLATQHTQNPPHGQHCRGLEQ